MPRFGTLRRKQKNRTAETSIGTLDKDLDDEDDQPRGKRIRIGPPKSSKIKKISRISEHPQSEDSLLYSTKPKVAETKRRKKAALAATFQQNKKDLHALPAFNHAHSSGIELKDVAEAFKSAKVGIVKSMEDAVEAVGQPQGSPISLSVKYVFRKSIEALKSNVPLDYGVGEVEFAVVKFGERRRLFAPADSLCLKIELQVRIEDSVPDVCPGREKSLVTAWAAEIAYSTTVLSDHKRAFASMTSTCLNFVCPDGGGRHDTPHFNFIDQRSTSRTSKDVTCSGIIKSEFQKLSLFREAHVYVNYKLIIAQEKDKRDFSKAAKLNPHASLPMERDSTPATKKRKMADNVVAPVMPDGQLCQLEKVIGAELTGGCIFYLVKWEDWDHEFDTWEPAAALQMATEAIDDFTAEFGKPTTKTPKVLSAEGQAFEVMHGLPSVQGKIGNSFIKAA